MTASLEIDYKQLAAELVAQNASLKAVSATPTAAYGHGPTGLFSAPGVDPTIYNAMQLPAVGLESLLPERPTNVVTPVYNIVTGQTATSGSEPSTACADWPTAGLTKLCGFQTTLSRQGRSTQVFDVTRVGQRTNNADMMNYQLAGDPLVGDVSQANSPTFPGAAGNGFLNTELAKAMREVRVAMIRDFAPDIYTGNPANNSGTGRLYYKGLDLLVNTGYADYETSTACPASDSLIVAWTGGDISTAPNGANLVLTLVDMYRRLMIIADESGMSRGGIEFVLVMPRSLFYEVSAAWPCAYYTARCQVPGAVQVTVDATDQTEMRDKLRSGSYLLFDGQPVRVVQDVSIPKTALTGVDAGSYTGTIYFLPLKVLGNQSPLYKEFFDWNGPGAAMDFLKGLGGNMANNFSTSDNGKYLWLFQPPTSYCVQIEVISRQTLVLRTPYLAGRLTGVRWTPLNMERSPFTTDSTYVNGGKTARS
jgi:hypothetical protein